MLGFLLAAQSGWSYQPTEDLHLWTFPSAGEVPPNLRFLVSIGGMQDEIESSMLLADEPLLQLVDFDGHPVPVKFVQGPLGLIEGVPERELEAETYYRLRMHPEVPKPTHYQKQLAEAAQRVVWRVSLPRDVEPPTWTDPVEILAMRRSLRMSWEYPVPEGFDRELELSFSISDPEGSPMYLFWTDSPLDAPNQVDFEHHQKAVNGSNVFCCFPPTDRLLRLRLRDAAGNHSSIPFAFGQ